MERLPNARPEQTKVELDTYKDAVGPIVSILNELKFSAPDAYEFFGGDIEKWHIDELPLRDTEEQHARLLKALDVVIAFKDAALSPVDDGSRVGRLKALRADFNHTLYGLPAQ